MRGLACQALGDHSQALADFAAEIRLHPENPEARFWRALLRYDRQERRACLADLERAMTLPLARQKEWRVVWGPAIRRLLADDFAGAARAVREGGLGETSMAHLARGLESLRASRPAEALKEFERSLDREPLIQLHKTFLVGVALLRLGRGKEALERFRQVARLAPGFRWQGASVSQWAARARRSYGRPTPPAAARRIRQG